MSKSVSEPQAVSTDDPRPSPALPPGARLIRPGEAAPHWGVHGYSQAQAGAQLARVRLRNRRDHTEAAGLAALVLTSTRDLFLSGASLFHRAMLRAGDQPELVVFEGLNHAFWTNPTLPESDEAYRIAAKFFERHLSGPDR